MKLNHLEFMLMDNPIRARIQEKYELPILIKLLNSNTFDSVLEIGCGNGNGTKLIKKYFNPLHITAIDLDEKMIQIAQEKFSGRSTVFHAMDASNLEFPDESFDAIFDFGIIHHIPNWKDCIKELRRVLKRGGKLILEELSIETFSGFPGRIYKSLLSHPYEQMFSIDEFLQSIENAGFEIIGFKLSNPCKMMQHFSLVASVQ